MSTNKDLIRRYADAFSRGDIDELTTSIFSPDATVQGVLGFGGMDVVVPIWRELVSAFAVQLQIDAIVEEGDQVAVRYTERGTFNGPFRGHEPTGKSYELVAMEWFEVKDGRIVRRWGARDHASQARQLGMKLG